MRKGNYSWKAFPCHRLGVKFGHGQAQWLEDGLSQDRGESVRETREEDVGDGGLGTESTPEHQPTQD